MKDVYVERKPYFNRTCYMHIIQVQLLMSLDNGFTIKLIAWPNQLTDMACITIIKLCENREWVRSVISDETLIWHPFELPPINIKYFFLYTTNLQIANVI